MKTEEVIKAIKEWHDKSDEKRAAVVILIDETEKENFLKSDCAILGNNGKIVSGLKALMKESEPFNQMVKRANMECFIEKIIEK